MPFFIGGAIQFAHDILYYFTFRNIKPREELSKQALELSQEPEDLRWGAA